MVARDSRFPTFRKRNSQSFFRYRRSLNRSSAFKRRSRQSSFGVREKKSIVVVQCSREVHSSPTLRRSPQSFSDAQEKKSTVVFERLGEDYSRSSAFRRKNPQSFFIIEPTQRSTYFSSVGSYQCYETPGNYSGQTGQIICLLCICAYVRELTKLLMLLAVRYVFLIVTTTLSTLKACVYFTGFLSKSYLFSAVAVVIQ